MIKTSDTAIFLFYMVMMFCGFMVFVCCLNGVKSSQNQAIIRKLEEFEASKGAGAPHAKQEDGYQRVQ